MMLTCDRTQRHHYQTDDGLRCWSVTQVRHVLQPPSEWWQPHHAERGTRLHLYFALVLAAFNDLGDMPEAVMGLEGYCQGIRGWLDAERPEAVRIEEASLNRSLRIAGTPDALVGLGRRKALTILDLKTGGETKTDHCQLLAYRHLEGYREARAMLDLYVSAEGAVKEVERKPDPFQWAWFLAGLHVLKGREI